VFEWLCLQDFQRELVEKRKAVEKVLRNRSLSGSSAAVAVEGGELEASRDDPAATAALSNGNKKMALLQQKWTLLWRMSLDFKKKLQDNFASIVQVYSRHSGRHGGVHF